MSKTAKKIRAILTGKINPTPTTPLTTLLPPPEAIEEKKIAVLYVRLEQHIDDYENKQKKLNEIKDTISQERFDSLNLEYTKELNDSKPKLKDLSDIIQNKIELLCKEKNELLEEKSQIQKNIDQEENLLKAGAISENEYTGKIEPLKSLKLGNNRKIEVVTIKLKILREKDIPPEGTPPEGTPPERTPPKEVIIDLPPTPNPSVAVLLSFFWAGAGQIYNGEIGKGIFFIVLYSISILLMFFLVGFITTPLLWIWGMYDAYNSALRFYIRLGV